MKHIVGVADMKVSSDPSDTIITYALGSCLAIALYDPAAHVGGILHVMLPLSTVDPAKAADRPFMFMDTGVPRLFLECYRAGAQKHRLIVRAAGGACASGNEAEDCFQIGKRNFIIFRKLLWKDGVLLHAHDVGGSQSRNMTLDIGSGTVTIRSSGETRTL